MLFCFSHVDLCLLGPLVTNTPRAFPCASSWSSMGSVVVPCVRFRLFWVLLSPHYVSFHSVAHAICDYIVLIIVISMPFFTFHSWPLACLCCFPLVDIHVQVSITLNEFCYVTSCVNLLSFQSIHPGIMFGLSHGLVSLHLHIHIGLVHRLPNGILLKAFVATVGDMYAFRSLKKACFHFRCTLYVPCSG